MNEYGYTKVVNAEQLAKQVTSTPTLSADYSHVNTDSDSVVLYFLSELSSAQQTTLGNLVSAHVPSSIGSKNYCVKEYSNSKRLLIETWYHTDDGDDTYSGLVERTTYTYESNKLVSHKIEEFWLDGTVMSSVEYTYHSNGTNTILKKVI